MNAEGVSELEPAVLVVAGVHGAGVVGVKGVAVFGFSGGVRGLVVSVWLDGASPGTVGWGAVVASCAHAAERDPAHAAARKMPRNWLVFLISRPAPTPKNAQENFEFR